MKKNKIRLTESQLCRVINESVKRLLRESDWRLFMNASKKAKAQGDNTRAMKFSNYANQLMNRRDLQGQYNKGAKELSRIDSAKKNGQGYMMNTFYNAFAQDDADMNNDWRNYVQGKSYYINGQGWQ